MAELSKRDKLAVAAAMNQLNQVAESLQAVPGLFEVGCHHGRREPAACVL